MNPFGHVDLRVTSLTEALPFYEALLPALGFTRTFHSAQWRVFAAEGELPSVPYVAFTEDGEHQPNGNAIAFWAPDPATVDRIARIVHQHGGNITSGPGAMPISPSYYAVYFTDPSGNQFEVTYRID